ncbi:MAG: c-type cytochrome [Sandaracinaceae bacterium]
MPSRPPLDRPDDLAALDRYYAVGLACMGLLVVAFGAYRATEPSRRAAALEAMEAQNIQLGREAYGRHCASCHGPEGRGGLGSPTLAATELLSQVSDEQLRWLIAGGVPGTTMSGYGIDRGGPFTAQDIQQVVAYLRALEDSATSVPDWRAGAVAPPPPREADRLGGERAGERPPTADRTARDADEPGGAVAPAAGGLTAVARERAQRLYGQHCAGCHGPAGQGTPIAQGVRPPRPALRGDVQALADVIAEGVDGTAMRGYGAGAGGPFDRATVRQLAAWLLAAEP